MTVLYSPARVDELLDYVYDKYQLPCSRKKTLGDESLVRMERVMIDCIAIRCTAFLCDENYANTILAARGF